MRNRKIQYSAAIFHFQAIIGLFNWTINWIVRRNAHVALPYLWSNWINVVQDYLGKRRSILAFIRRMRNVRVPDSLEHSIFHLNMVVPTRKTFRNFRLYKTQNRFCLSAEEIRILWIFANLLKMLLKMLIELLRKNHNENLQRDCNLKDFE